MPTKQTRKKLAKLPLHKRVHKRVKLAVVPHKANQYRPHLVSRYGILAMLIALLITHGIYNGVTSGNVLGAEAQITSQGLLDATNKQRVENHKLPLTLNADLSRAAYLKAQNMFAQQYWAHVAPDGTTPWHWFGEVQYAYSVAGENLAKNFTTSDNTVAAWMSSSTHRANILKEGYKDVGFAVMEGKLNGKETTLVVALYGAPAQAATQGVLASTQLSSVDIPMSAMGAIGMGLNSLSPVTISSIVILLVAANIALVAHAYRRKLPLSLRRSWYRHHGLYKAIGFASLAIIVVFAYGSVGQI